MVHNAVPSLLLPSTKPPRQPGRYEHTKGTPWVPILCHLWGREQAGGCSQHLSTMLTARFPLRGSQPCSLGSWEPRCRIPLGSTALPAAPRSLHTSLALCLPVQALETNPALGTRGALSCPAPISLLSGLGMLPLLPRHGLEGRPGISLMLQIYICLIFFFPLGIGEGRSCSQNEDPSPPHPTPGSSPQGRRHGGDGGEAGGAGSNVVRPELCCLLPKGR